MSYDQELRDVKEELIRALLDAGVLLNRVYKHNELWDIIERL